jgi:hypothetical protein
LTRTFFALGKPGRYKTYPSLTLPYEERERKTPPSSLGEEILLEFLVDFLL